MPETPTPPAPASTARVAGTIAGTMTLGGAMAVVTVAVLEQVGFTADANMGIALGVIWNAVLGRAARYLP